MSSENRNTHYPVKPETAEVLRETLLVRGRTPDDDPSPEQIAIYRRMPGARRLKLAQQMFWFARDLKTSGVRHQHPDWTEEQVRTEVNRIFPACARVTCFCCLSAHSIVRRFAT